jgi:hypothetical protein
MGTQKEVHENNRQLQSSFLSCRYAIEMNLIETKESGIQIAWRHADLAATLSRAAKSHTEQCALKNKSDVLIAYEVQRLEHRICSKHAELELDKEERKRHD